MGGHDLEKLRRRNLGVVLQISALSDIAIGVALMVFGPSLLAGGADTILTFVGAALALSGVGIWLWGRAMRRRAGEDGNSGTVVRTRR